MANPTASLAGGVLSTVFMIAVFFGRNDHPAPVSPTQRQAAAESSSKIKFCKQQNLL
jgi:hypothetical protein